MVNVVRLIVSDPQKDTYDHFHDNIYDSYRVLVTGSVSHFFKHKVDVVKLS